jgi:hypothetical protein
MSGPHSSGSRRGVDSAAAAAVGNPPHSGSISVDDSLSQIPPKGNNIFHRAETGPSSLTQFPNISVNLPKYSHLLAAPLMGKLIFSKFHFLGLGVFCRPCYNVLQ